MNYITVQGIVAYIESIILCAETTIYNYNSNIVNNSTNYIFVFCPKFCFTFLWNAPKELKKEMWVDGFLIKVDKQFIQEIGAAYITDRMGREKH